MDKKKVRVLVDNPEAEIKSARPSLEELVRTPFGKTIEFETSVLAERLSSTYATLVDIISELPLSGNNYQANTVSFTLGIDASGDVSIVSTVSGGVKTQVGLTFTLTLKDTKSNASTKKARK
ncbi:MAG: hypothetical protein H6635_00155 [Anaerolineales bacterium]|nr:hypothetical protein [Anaerolineales bacterium]